MATRNGQEWVREARAVLRRMSDRELPARGWRALQERDREGNPIGPLPYTDEAIRDFTAAHERDPEDPGVAHHLAIAHHARAWDWELGGDERAASEWKRALDYWRMIAASREFWAAMKTRLLACHAEADPAFLDDMRRDLLEHLLEVHVAFVRHYCESDEPGRANSHIQIVQRAQLPPAVKKRLVGKVFDAMTGAVPEARATGAYESAFVVIERFLKLFPDYLPALRMHAEIAKERAVGLLFQTQWEEILKLGARAVTHARRIAEHPELNDQPLARTALEELALELAAHGHSRGGKYLANIQPPHHDVAELDAATEAFDLALVWSRLGASGARMKPYLGASWRDRGICCYYKALEVRASSALDERTKIGAATPLYRAAVEHLEEAFKYANENAEMEDFLKHLRDELSWLETHLALLEAAPRTPAEDWRNWR